MSEKERERENLIVDVVLFSRAASHTPIVFNLVRTSLV